MEEGKPISHIVAGLLIALIVVVLSIVIGLVGGGGIGPSGGWISFLIIIIGLIFFIQHFGKTKNNEVSFGALFSYGFKATTMIVLLNVVYLLILSFAAPELKQQGLEATRQGLEQQKLTSEEMNKMMEMTNKYFWIILIGTSMFLIAVFGAIGSLLGAAITKKPTKNPFGQTTL